MAYLIRIFFAGVAVFFAHRGLDIIHEGEPAASPVVYWLVLVGAALVGYLLGGHSVEGEMNPTYKKCSYCDEKIRPKAKRCKWCHKDFGPT